METEWGGVGAEFGENEAGANGVAPDGVARSGRVLKQEPTSFQWESATCHDDRRGPPTAHPNALWMGLGWGPLGCATGRDEAPKPHRNALWMGRMGFLVFWMDVSRQRHGPDSARESAR